jgi:hypothetical protein
MMRLLAVIAASILMIGFQAREANSQTTARAGVAVNLSTLGYGFGAAVPVAEQANVRVGFNFLNVSHDFDNDGITMAAQLKLRSVNAYFDWFPFAGSFHVSPGLMLYNGNRVEATAFTPGGTQFNLGHDTLLSNPSNPVHGDATIAFKRVAPSVTFGWGNVVPRGEKRWSIPVELGVVFSRPPTATLNLAGSACLPNGTNCRNIAAEPLLQADLRQEEANLNDDLSVLKIIPVISVGFSYGF